MNQPLQQPLGYVPNNFWLAGFFDGDGCVYLSVITRSHKKRLKRDELSSSTTRYTQCSVHVKISQAQPELMLAVAAFFGFPRPEKKTRSEIKKAGQRRTYYSIASQSKAKVKFWLDYFSQYPLQSKKRAQLALVSQGFELIRAKQHLTPQGQNTFLEWQALKQGLVIEHYEDQLYRWVPKKDKSEKGPSGVDVLTDPTDPIDYSDKL